MVKPSLINQILLWKMGTSFASILVRNLKYLTDPSKLSYKNNLCALVVHVESKNCFISRFFKTYNFLLSEQKFTRDRTKIIKKDGTVVKVKTEEIPKIKLIYESKEILVTLEEAKKIAKHKRLNLIKVDSSQNKCLRDIYELVTDNKFLNEKTSSQNKIKKNKEKTFKFSSKISDNDIKIKVKNILRSFKSCDSVKCYIKFDNDQITDDVFEKITKELGASYSVQKIPSSTNVIQFMIYKSENGNGN